MHGQQNIKSYRENFHELDEFCLHPISWFLFSNLLPYSDKAKGFLRSLLFSDIKQLRFVVNTRCFFTTCLFIFNGQTVETCLLVAPVGCPESSVPNYKSKLYDIQEEYLIYMAVRPEITQVIRLFSKGLRGALGPIQL